MFSQLDSFFTGTTNYIEQMSTAHRCTVVAIVAPVIVAASYLAAHLTIGG